MFPNDNANTTPNVTATSDTSKRTSGVADYFAILGVGETLVFKHSQKKNGTAIDDAGGEDENKVVEENDETSNENREDEAALLERFYREIVEVAVVRSTSDNLSGAGNDGTETTATTGGGEHGDDADAEGEEAYHGTELRNVMSDDSVLSGSGVGVDDSGDTPTAGNRKRYARSNAASRVTKEVIGGGYTVIRSTIPAGRGANVKNGSNPLKHRNHGGRTSPPQSGTDDSMLSTTSVNDSESGSRFVAGVLGRKAGGGNGGTEIWAKSQTFDADLHPVFGLRGELLSSLSIPEEEEEQNGYYNRVSTGRRLTGAMGSARHLFSSDGRSERGGHGSGDNSNRALRGLGRKVGSTLRNQIVPILGNAAGSSFSDVQGGSRRRRPGEGMVDRGIADGGGGGGSWEDTSIFSPGRKFHLAYRRRGADENDRPAVADLTIRYARIHRSTMYREPSRSHSLHPHSTSLSSTSSPPPAGLSPLHQQPDLSDLRNDGMSSRAKLGGGSGAAALRRGFATGAGIAARVAGAGKNRIMERYRGSNAMASSEEPQYYAQSDRSPPISLSLTRSHFFPDSEATTCNKIPTSSLHGNVPLPASHASVAGDDEEGGMGRRQRQQFLVIPLAEILPSPPGGYDEWSIPEEFRLIRLPRPTPASSPLKQRQQHPPLSKRGSTTASLNISEKVLKSSSGSAEETKGDDPDSEERAKSAEERRRLEREQRRSQRRIRRTFLFPHQSGLVGSDAAIGGGDDDTQMSDGSGMGMEAYVDGGSFLRSSASMSSSSHGSSPDGKRRRRPWTPTSPADLPNSSSWTMPGEGGEFLDVPLDPDIYMPSLLSEPLPSPNDLGGGDYQFEYVPVVAVRRQRVGDEERFHEDPAVVDIAVTFCDGVGMPVMPSDDDDCCDDDEEEEEGTLSLLGRTKWIPSSSRMSHSTSELETVTKRTASGMPNQPLGTPTILLRRNLPLGFADAPFATSVLDRFPKKNYKGHPLPEEELPMFCYPTGCRLHRALFKDAPLAEYYGFVLKNERGDSIYVSCVSFMEPLTSAKLEQLNRISEQRRRTFLPHRFFCEKRERRATRNRRRSDHGSASHKSGLYSFDESDEGTSVHRPSEESDFLMTFDEDNGAATHCDGESSDEGGIYDDFLLTGFDEMVTFENKTICLISRYPFWTAFRRFLSHLHILSGSSSELPLERYISHLLLKVPIPKVGGPYIVVPLPTLSVPMVLALPPAKDLPLLDLPYQRVFACLDVPTVVTIVLGFLALERKVIVMSTHPSLVLDGCELLRSLLFPFELCAPYVPRLTQPFMSCLDFPGAIFVGIHDDGTDDGLATVVRKNMPEDSAIVDLDTGEIDCSGDRFEILKQCWGIIPSGPRSVLVSEVETICRDAGLAPGQEPIDSQIDSAFDASVPTTLVEDFDDRGHHAQEPLDDRAVRDAFLRFFCSILGGYERFLVVPDMDFLISGNEWFDAQGFLAGAPQDYAPFLGSLVTTQLFQSFIQRRTEASDVHCMLFDECLAEYHSSKIPYGRLGGDVETVMTLEGGEQQTLFSLLVDQCATETHLHDLSDDRSRCLDLERSKGSVASFDGSDDDTDVSTGLAGLSLNANDGNNDVGRSGRASAETSLASGLNAESGFVTNNSGDIVMPPAKDYIPEGSRFIYCVDGNPCFPHRLDPDLFLPAEPERLSAELSETPVPVLTRSDRELDEANRRRKISTSYRGLHNQRRCLWQLPKLMGSHVLGAWLMCIPTQVSQQNLTPEQQTRYLLRGLGAFRLLRSRQRIVPDEAAYRAIMVACGRTGSDRRVELVKLFGLLRSDGIFPSAVTLGQYTKAIAEGFSKRFSGTADDGHTDALGVEVTVSASREGGINVGSKDRIDYEVALNMLDSNLLILEESGKRWRQRQQNREPAIMGRTKMDMGAEGASFGKGSGAMPGSLPKQKTGSKRRHHKTWLPVCCSSSFSPISQTSSSTTAMSVKHADYRVENHVIRREDFKVVALWSRTVSCHTCSYIPLDEEVQSGWDVVGGEHDVPGAVSCPRCGSLIIPMIGYRELTLDEACRHGIGGKTEKVSSNVQRKNAESSLAHKLPCSRSGQSTPPSSVASYDTTSTCTFNGDTLREYVAQGFGTKFAGNHRTDFQNTSKKSASSKELSQRGRNIIHTDFMDLPPQLRPSIRYSEHTSSGMSSPGRGQGKEVPGSAAGFVTYLSPSAMRASLERYVEERGEEVLERETLRELDPDLFYNLWWFCARFSLPLPLSIVSPLDTCLTVKHYCAFAAWDESVAEHGCKSGAKVILSLICSPSSQKDGHHRHEYSNGKDDTVVGEHVAHIVSPFEDFPLLSHFNIQAYAQADWDHPDLSNILVSLVEACDKRDFRTVVDCVFRCNRRRGAFGSKLKESQHTISASGSEVGSGCMEDDLTSSDSGFTASAELDCYRTILYLAKYQCTTAFHVFFPAATKPCKGYHFWCATGTPLPIFDRLFRDAVKRLRGKDNTFTPVQDVSDVALGFRCVFGHLI